MTNSTNYYSGLMGYIRLLIIKCKIKKIEAELQTVYNGAQKDYINTKTWKEASKLIFLSSIKVLHDKFCGLYDVGFVKMCENWLEKFGVSCLDDALATEMCSTILPKDIFALVQESLTTKKRGK